MKEKSSPCANVGMERVYLKDGDYFFPSEPAIKADSLRTKSLLHRFNHTDPADTDSRQQLMKDLLPECGEGVSITAPFYCSRGYNIRAGKNFYCNFDCIILDLTDVIIGNDVQLGPQVNIYTVSHPVNPGHRSTGIEYVRPVTIGDRVWVGGKSVILPGVRIGNDVVIAAGSVVTRDIPDRAIAGGVPARVLKYIQ
ncbi:TPA: sugar O-acetyltransferase [Enterobacter hormaechei subsp. steigerwaltii]|uniref:sugar O-acetyltransferase n=1 Tax=Enterobacter hormaechei TaxID=158836 RepID=UPI0016522E24|nr:sugar O-acetyltransferase [Enterobacter hormaechei]HAV1523730.1 sugar O-acetyltransferase [Enterobacter hormaechei subsp. steigerwaltii]HAV1910639.1 sugar O-acetyltransferase [Enterobacter hormaechei subsp. steigerwaltii]